MKSKQVDGYKFKCKYPIYLYILDFYCDEKHMAIELDCDIHKDKKDYDDYRDDSMKRKGITTLRFHNDEVMKDLDAVIYEIK